MTVIVWDGKVLAADKRATSNGIHRTVTKIRRIGECLVGVSGGFDKGCGMFAWFESGASIDKYPKFQEDGDWCDVLVIMPDGQIRKYEKTPYFILFEDKTFAMGSGRDFALAAMHLGCTAVESVTVASLFDIGCGNGIDTLTIL